MAFLYTAGGGPAASAGTGGGVDTLHTAGGALKPWGSARTGANPGEGGTANTGAAGSPLDKSGGGDFAQYEDQSSDPGTCCGERPRGAKATEEALSTIGAAPVFWDGAQDGAHKNGNLQDTGEVQ